MNKRLRRLEREARMLKALVIQDDKGKIKDLGDVLAIARAEGQKLFHTRRNVQVIRVFYDRDIGWVVVIKYEGRIQASGCKRRSETAKWAKGK